MQRLPVRNLYVYVSAGDGLDVTVVVVALCVEVVVVWDQGLCEDLWILMIRGLVRM